MKPFTEQKLEACGMFAKLFGSKPTENGWKELNNLLATSDNINNIDAEQVKSTLKKWGVKFNEENIANRSNIYRKFADRVYAEIQNNEDDLLKQALHLAEILDLPQHLLKMADKNAKTAAYFLRCRNILHNEEKLDIHAINKLFGYDYEDGLAIRKQVFQAYFDNIFNDISQTERYSPKQEEALRSDCQKLDIPYEFKNNILNALKKYRDLWNAENNPLGNIKLDLPLNEGEICHASVNCGLCQTKVIEKEDNYFEVTRKFRIDETVNFKGEKLEHPKIKEEATILLELGHFVLTNQRIIYISKKNAFATKLQDITSADFDNINMVTFQVKNKGPLQFKFPDEAAGVMFILFNKAYKNIK